MKLWAGKVLLLLRMKVKGWEEEREFAFFQDKDVSSPRDNVGRVLRSVSLRWSIDDDIDYTLAEGGRSSSEQLLSDGVLLGVKPFRFVRRTIHVVRENFSEAPYTEELPWPLRGFYINRFYKALL